MAVKCKIKIMKITKMYSFYESTLINNTFKIKNWVGKNISILYTYILITHILITIVVCKKIIFYIPCILKMSLYLFCEYRISQKFNDDRDFWIYYSNKVLNI